MLCPREGSLSFSYNLIFMTIVMSLPAGSMMMSVQVLEGQSLLSSDVLSFGKDTGYLSAITSR